MTFGNPGLQVVCDPADIFHQCRRIPEYTLINTLQDEAELAGPLGGVNDKRIIDVTAAVACRGVELAIQIELE